MLAKRRSETTRETELLVCEALEECRLRCEQLSDAGYASPALRTVHRHLGLAGYNASVRLSRSDREESLLLAIGKAGSLTGSAREAELTLARHAEHAARSIRRAARSGMPDHLNVAREHLTLARRCLRAPVLPRSLPGPSHTRGVEANVARRDVSEWRDTRASLQSG